MYWYSFVTQWTQKVLLYVPCQASRRIPKENIYCQQWSCGYVNSFDYDSTMGPKPIRRTVGQIPIKYKETSNLMWLSFVCSLKLILYNSKPQNQMCDWYQKCFGFVLQKSWIKLFTWLTHLTLKFLYILGRCGAQSTFALSLMLPPEIA